MENEITTDQFCGIDLYNSKDWDIMDADSFYCYDVEFIMPSMQKYNGMDVWRWFDGKMKIYDGDNAEEIVWEGYVTDIKEVMEALNERMEG